MTENATDETLGADWHLEWESAGPRIGKPCTCGIGEDHPSAGPWPELLEALVLAPETRQDDQA